MPVGSSEIPLILPSASSSPLSWSLGNPAQPFWIQGEVPFLPDSTAWLVIPPNRAPDCPTCMGRKWMPRSPSDSALWTEHPLPGSKRPVIPSQTVIFLPLHSFALCVVIILICQAVSHRAKHSANLVCVPICSMSST